MKKTLKNKPFRAEPSRRRPKTTTFHAHSVLRIITIISFLANLLSPALAKAAMIDNLYGFTLNDSTTTANTTFSAFAGAIDSSDNVTETALSESPSAKIFKNLPIPNKVVSGLVTVYSSTPGQTDDSPFYTANGKHVYDGLIAVNGYPFGTKIKIPALYGDKIFTVDDRMNARYGNKNFDIWMDAPMSELRKLGARRTLVEIYLPATELAVK